MPHRSWTSVSGAALLAGLLSGAPSTVHALATGRSVLAATRAAGTVLGRASIPRGALAHALITAWWTTVLAFALPRRATAVWGAAGGLAIGVLDLAVARRRFPAIAALPRRPQLADHIAFGVVVGAVLGRARRVDR